MGGIMNDYDPRLAAGLSRQQLEAHWMPFTGKRKLIASATDCQSTTIGKDGRMT